MSIERFWKKILRNLMLDRVTVRQMTIGFVVGASSTIAIWLSQHK